LEENSGRIGNEVEIMGVWIPELVDYFNTRLATISVDNKPISVTFSAPDITSRPDDIMNLVPEINFKYYDILADKTRYESDILVKGNANTSNNTIQTKDMPIPYNIFFAFTLAAAYMDDIVQMESIFTSYFPPRAVISVLDPSINDTYDLDMWQRGYRIIETENLATAHYGQIPLRLFRRVFRYVVRCEHDIYNWTTSQTVKTVNPTITTE
jgi:hypothetical protein